MFKEYLDTKSLALWHRLTDSARRVVVVGHASPDGDAMGSALALAHVLQEQGRQVAVIMPNLFPDFLAWLPGADAVINAEYHKKMTYSVLADADLLCCLDFNALHRTEWMTPMLEQTECYGTLGCSSGLGDYIYGEITITDHIAELADISTADVISTVVDLRCLADGLVYHVVEAMTQCLDGCTGSQIGTADTDHKKDIGITLDLGCCLLDPVKLFLVIIYREVDPAQEIISLAGLLNQCLLSRDHAVLHCCDICICSKCFRVTEIK